MTVEEWLGEDNTLGIDIWNKKYKYKDESFEEWLDRVSDKNEEVKRLIREKKFLFGGRTLANRNTGKKASYSNCYSSGYVSDSLEGIMDTAKNIALTYKAQGGQGLSLSKIRPRGTKINNEFNSDGIIPFMKIFNEVTEGISQGGSRKGALMISLSCNHKEVIDFINIKGQNNVITKANLSVEIDDNFMEAVEKYYKTGEIVELHFTKDYEGNTIEYSLIPIEIYKQIINQAYDWGEPGVILTNRFRNYNLMEFIDEYMVITGNPCGEQPLPPNGACNLASLLLSLYVKNPFLPTAKFDIDEFKKDVAIAIKALDDILEEGKELHPLQEQKIMATNYRNIGLGIMGLGDTFYKLGIKYGSEKSKRFVDMLFFEMFRTAVETSVGLAKERGVFPKYSDKVFDSTIIKKHFTDDEINEMKKHGIRNCSLLSIAPTGTIGTMLNVSTGIEPNFEISYQRVTESLHKDKKANYTVFIGVAKEYSEKFKTDELPDYFITTHQINWKDRIELQAIVQEHIDTAISSTVNLPKEVTKEEIEQLYLYAWKKGLKGITIFRDGCKRLGILTSKNNEDTSIQKPSKLGWGTTIQASDDLIGKKRKIMSGCGSLHVQAWFDPIDGRLTEIYLSKGSEGGCNSFMVALSRTISAGLRTGLSFDYAIDQLKSVPTCPSYAVRTTTKKDTSKGNCCPAAIANALIEMQKEINNELYDDEIELEKQESEDVKNDKDMLCPECDISLHNEGGCLQCRSCGWSRCE